MTYRASLFLKAGAGLIALHVADDMLLQPEPGTSALDHLPGALIQLAIILGLAVLVERGKAGVRASAMAALGLFSLIASSEAVHNTASLGIQGDEPTGLLLIPVGLAFLGGAVATAWRSRRLDDDPRWRYGRRLLRAVGVVAIAALVVFPVGLGYVTTHLMRTDVPENELGVAHERVSFETPDGLTLKGWYVPSRNGAAVIVFPGRGSSQRQARVLAKHGYGALVFDRRGEGESDGDSNMFGWGGDEDIRGAVDFLERRPDVDDDRIAGIGLSVGGELMLEVAAEGDELDAVIAEGAGSRSYLEDLHEAHGIDVVLGQPILSLKTASIAAFSSQSPPPDLNKALKRIKAPTMLMWSDAPNDVRGWDYYDLLRSPKEKLYMPEARHVGGITARPAQYERRLIGFLDRYVGR